MRLRRLVVAAAMLAAPLLGATAAAGQTNSSSQASWAYYYAELHYEIVGTGAYVNYFYRAITNEDWPGTLYTSSRMCGPGGCTTWILYGTALQNTTNASYGENRDLPAGTYCAQFDLYGKPVTQKCYSVS